MIELRNLFKTYNKKSDGKLVLDNVSLSVAAGEIFGIIGKSGAGKSTLLKCVNHLEAPDTGDVIIDGVNLLELSHSELRVKRQDIGMIFQNFNLLESKNIFANIALPLVLLKKHSKIEVKARINELLELVGLLDFANKHPSQLSGGQRQRVGIARALATNPKILLCDEATSALDPQTTSSILDLLLDINQKFGVTILLITHEIEVIRKICDKVAVIDRGEIVEQGAVVDVILHPKHELTRKLIIEEETSKYLEQVSDFYKFRKDLNNHLIVISFIGNSTFDPILSELMRETGVVCIILRGELGRIKRMPFGQLLIEISGEDDQLKKAFSHLDQKKLHYEIIS
jgi:D-methionine transport system ATP-binding protein